MRKMNSDNSLWNAMTSHRRYGSLRSMFSFATFPDKNCSTQLLYIIFPIFGLILCHFSCIHLCICLPPKTKNLVTYSLSSRRKNLIHKARFFSENCAYIYTDIHTYILGILCQASAPDQEPTCTTHQSGSSTLAQILHASGKHTATITAKNAFYTTFFYDIKLN